MKNKTPNTIKYGFRPPEAAEALGSEKLLAECVTAGWIKPILKRHKLTLYDRAGIVCVPVSDLSPARLAIGWRRDDPRHAVRSFVDARTDAAGSGGSQDYRT